MSFTVWFMEKDDVMSRVALLLVLLIHTLFAAGPVGVLSFGVCVVSTLALGDSPLQSGENRSSDEFPVVVRLERGQGSSVFPLVC